jgi:hypothetical protein
MAYSPKSQKKYNEKMYFVTAKLNPTNSEDAALIAKIEHRMKDKSISRQAAVKELLQEAR